MRLPQITVPPSLWLPYLCLLLLLLGTGCGKPTAPTKAWFENVRNESRIDFKHVSGHQSRYFLPEIMGGGVGLLDYDQDGLLDIYFVQSGSLYPTSEQTKVGNKLYRNEGDGTFQDVTKAANVGDTSYGMGCACGDYDRDGDVDIYVTNVGANRLYRNNGDHTFTDVTPTAGVGDHGWGSSAAFLDYDADGFLDLMVANYVDWSPATEKECVMLGQPSYCSPKNYSPATDVLYRNQGDGTFQDVTHQVGMHAAFGNGLGVACEDFNQDGHTDIYVANDATMNQLWINNGEGGFTDQALLCACALNKEGIAEAGMGVAAVDMDNDGDVDLFMSHLRRETNTYYANVGGDFEDVTNLTGLAAPSLAFTGFGLGIADFDHDGYLDIYVVNGRVERAEPRYDASDPYAEPNQLFQGTQDGSFGEVLPLGGTVGTCVGTSRGAAFGDLDNDGDVDIVVVNRDKLPYLLRNIGGRGNWIQFSVLNKQGSAAVGARVRLRAGNSVRWRSVQPASSYCSSNDPRLHFGLGLTNRVDSIDVYWPDGHTEAHGPLDAGQLYEIRREGYVIGR